MDSKDSKKDIGRSARRTAFLQAAGVSVGPSLGSRPPPGFAAFSASYIRRVEVVAALFGALYPFSYLIYDLISGRVPPYLHYLPALLAMLLLALAAFLLGPTRLVTSLFVAVIYVGFALTLRLPNARAVYIPIFIFAIPFFYFIAGCRAGHLCYQ